LKLLEFCWLKELRAASSSPGPAVLNEPDVTVVELLDVPLASASKAGPGSENCADCAKRNVCAEFQVTVTTLLAWPLAFKQ
jgi:hypothetical protein